MSYELIEMSKFNVNWMLAIYIINTGYIMVYKFQ